jgi:hypothetical protein
MAYTKPESVVSPRDAGDFLSSYTTLRRMGGLGTMGR